MTVGGMGFIPERLLMMMMMMMMMMIYIYTGIFSSSITIIITLIFTIFISNGSSKLYILFETRGGIDPPPSPAKDPSP